MKGQTQMIMGILLALIVLVAVGIGTINQLSGTLLNGVRVENQTATPASAAVQNFTISLNSIEQGILTIHQVANGSTQFGEISGFNCTSYLNIDDTSNRGNFTYLDSNRNAITVCGYRGVGPVSVSYSYKPFGYQESGVSRTVLPLVVTFLILGALGFAAIILSKR